MSLRFTVLASGSAGNASLVETGGSGILLDAGLGPRVLTARLATAGSSWSHVRAVVLTHTHSDHWHDRTFAQLLRRRIPVHCHAEHAVGLVNGSPSFAELAAQDLVRPYEPRRAWDLGGLTCQAFPVKHDGGPTFGFRFQSHSGALAYVADLGSWTHDLLDELADVDLLALEFNHDVALERQSGRSRYLIARVLGDRGHLSNVQAAALLREVLRRSEPGRLRHVVQLHLSRDCNRPELAHGAALDVLKEWPDSVAVHTAGQHEAGPSLTVGGSARATAPRPVQPVGGPPVPPLCQRWLPGWDG